MLKSRIQHTNRESWEIPEFSIYCTKKMKTGNKNRPQSACFTTSLVVKKDKETYKTKKLNY